MSGSEIVFVIRARGRGKRVVVFPRLIDYKIQSKVVSCPLKQTGADTTDFFRR